jgi:hypothetical protein
MTKPRRRIQTKIEAYSRAVEKLRADILFDDAITDDELATDAAAFFILATNALDNAHRYLTLAAFSAGSEPSGSV